jgi:hypothetical protein
MEEDDDDDDDYLVNFMKELSDHRVYRFSFTRYYLADSFHSFLPYFFFNCFHFLWLPFFSSPRIFSSFLKTLFPLDISHHLPYSLPFIFSSLFFFSGSYLLSFCFSLVPFTYLINNYTLIFISIFPYLHFILFLPFRSILFHSHFNAKIMGNLKNRIHAITMNI